MLYKTNFSQQTKRLAGLLAREILYAENLTNRHIRIKNALTLALSGDLGAGKTTFVQGFLRAAGIRKKITSPSFVLVKSYKLKVKSYKLIYHIDCYRIKKSKELLGLGLKEILNNPENIVLIEWPERIKKFLPKNLIWVKFKHGDKINQRIITILSGRSFK